MRLSPDHRIVVLCALLPLTVAATTIDTAPANADTGLSALLNALGAAGSPQTADAGAGSLGSSICAAISEPGQTLASIASGLAVRDGTSVQVSKMITGLAISIYCPTAMSSLAGDDWLSLLGNAGV